MPSKSKSKSVKRSSRTTTKALPAKRKKPAGKVRRSSTPASKRSPAKTKRVAGSKAKPPKLLAGGNPQIAKAEGDAPVQEYIAAIPGWKRDVARRLDALIARTIPGVRKAVKWNSPFYGVEGQGWFVSFHVFNRYLKVAFFRGTALRPVPPGGTGQDSRWIDVHEDDLDETQMADWIRQAAALPGFLAPGGTRDTGPGTRDA